MIWSISKQPDYKLFIWEEDLKELKNQSQISWKIFNHSTREVIDLILRKDLSLNDWVTREWIQTVLVSDKIIQELWENWFIWWLRLNWNTVKITFVVKERLKDLWISSDDKMTLSWALEDLENMIS